MTNVKTVLDMDLLWLDGAKVAMAFEVESTTTMTSGLLRGSNLPAETPKVMVLPEERENDFQRKMQSPLFAEHFAGDSWRRIYFSALRNAYAKSRDATSLDGLYDVRHRTANAPRVEEMSQPSFDL